jgi:hypothetical protein
MAKKALITVATLVGLFVIAESVMPGHWDRLLAYLEGNLAALESWVR